MRTKVSLYVMLCGVATLLLIVVLFFYSTDNSHIVESSISEVDHSHAHVAARSTSSTTIQSDYPPRKQQIAWTEIQLDDSLPKSKWNRVPDHAVFVSLNGRFDQWLLNTPVEVYIPHIDTTYNAVVDRITPNGLHSTTIRASADADENELQRFILTFGEDQTLAYISTTTQGSWELTGDGQIGWLVSTAELKRSQDYSQPDVLNEHYDRYAGAEYVPRRDE